MTKNTIFSLQNRNNFNDQLISIKNESGSNLTYYCTIKIHWLA